MNNEVCRELLRRAVRVVNEATTTRWGGWGCRISAAPSNRSNLNKLRQRVQPSRISGQPRAKNSGNGGPTHCFEDPPGNVQNFRMYEADGKTILAGLNLLST